MLAKEYIAVALIRAKKTFFSESFITSTELNQFNDFIQQEFNSQELGIVISSNYLDRKEFNIVGPIIMISDTCCYNLDRLPLNLFNVLTDPNLLVNFFRKIENEKLKEIEEIQTEISNLSNSYRREKILK